MHRGPGPTVATVGVPLRLPCVIWPNRLTSKTTNRVAVGRQEAAAEVEVVEEVQIDQLPTDEAIRPCRWTAARLMPVI